MHPENPYAPPPPVPPPAVPVLAPPQTIRFVPELEDYWVAHKLVLELSKPAIRAERRKRQLMMIGGGVLAAIGITVAPMLEQPVIPWIAAILGGIGLLAGWLRPHVAKTYGREELLAAWSKAGFGPAEGPVSHLILEDRFRQEEEVGNFERYWRTILRVEHNSDCLVMWPRLSKSRISVPARAFASESAFLGWCALVERLVEEHATAPSEATP